MIANLRILHDPDDPEEYFPVRVDTDKVLKETFGEDFLKSVEDSSSQYRPPYAEVSSSQYRPPYAEVSSSQYRPPYAEVSSSQYRLPYAEDSSFQYRPPYAEDSSSQYWPSYAEVSSSQYRPPYTVDKNENSVETTENPREIHVITPDPDHIFGYPEHFVWKACPGNFDENVPNITQFERSKLAYDCYKTNQTDLNENLPGAPEDNAVYYPEKFLWNSSVVHQEVYLPPPIGPPYYLCNKRHLDPIQVGSVLEIPGLHFPNYKDIPLTSFSCSDKPYIPGYYADLETGCQVFHVCFGNRKESFLCPLGTIFNQAVLTCDYWYSTNCSMTPHLYELNARSQTASKEMHSTVKDFETDKTISSSGKNEEMLPTSTVKYYDPRPNVPHVKDEFRRYSSRHPPPESDLSHILKLLPIKTKVSVYPVSNETKVEAVASIGSHGERKHWSIYQPHPEFKPKLSTYSRGIDPSISKIIDDAFDIARQVIDRAAGFIPRRESQNVNRKETSKTTLPQT
ncbi:uncharacterized protein LOC118181264 [Stegodyphus dumicola]|uniref:uncharacterized protein LOC118181264 n=1 Tax=Stegodyphus dumicola TaxID=202533 RepID=UPI0015AF7041|nr:uncharacterized protein LOC118181264 [Stegodyphus dumicola]